MKATKEKNAIECEALIAKSCGTLIALPKTYLSAVKDFEETAILENLQKPLVGVAQNSGKAVLLADPKFIFGGKRKKSHIPKYLVFLESADRHISLQVDEIIGLKTIQIKSEANNQSKENSKAFFSIKLGRQKITMIKIDTLLNSLMGKEKRVQNKIAVDFAKTEQKTEEIRSYLSFIFEGQKFAIDIDNLNGVKPVKELNFLDTKSDKSIPMVDFNETICPFIGEDNSLYAIQAFISPESKNGDGRHVMTIGTSAKCELHDISSSQLVKTKKDTDEKKESSKLNRYKNSFEQSSEYGFDIDHNEHLRVINLQSVDTLKSLYPFSPKVQPNTKDKLDENISFLSVNGKNYKYLFPLTLLKKVSPISDIKISKNQNKSMAGYTNLDGKVIAVFELDVVLGGEDQKSDFILFLEFNEIMAGLAVPEINRVSISKHLIHDNIRKNNAAMFQEVAAARVVHKNTIYYQLDHKDLEKRLLKLSQ